MIVIIIILSGFIWREDALFLFIGFNRWTPHKEFINKKTIIASAQKYGIIGSRKDKEEKDFSSSPIGEKEKSNSCDYNYCLI